MLRNRHLEITTRRHIQFSYHIQYLTHCLPLDIYIISTKRQISMNLLSLVIANGSVLCCKILVLRITLLFKIKQCQVRVNDTDQRSHIDKPSINSISTESKEMHRQQSFQPAGQLKIELISRRQRKETLTKHQQIVFNLLLQTPPNI